jgi:hypothetical protein
VEKEPHAGLAEVALPQDLFQQILQRIWRLEPVPGSGERGNP